MNSAPDSTQMFGPAVLTSEEVQAELERRRDALAAPPPTDDSADLMAALVVVVGAERYGLPLSNVSEVFRLTTLTRLPGVPAHVVGLTNLRGDVMSVIDIRVFFDIALEELTDLPLAVVVQSGPRRLAILADGLDSLDDIRRDAILPPISTHTGIREEYQLGVTEDRCLLLNLERILSDPRLVVDQRD